ncbi:hypothetical protein TCAL_13662 [Tigriopus californicus]|uniref:Uncharacterized protein n=1 Tax=Tigriopus californicus TaxID=6832 RepID=A0A553PHV7_TIGCA|nr:putative uncharacterized protein DDB_G0286901 [Tigriopus californicus]TRY77266.1 hypothetical protein TCAL_13662 [Tigriopus californicus]|eukprot:TCALIF_13662-PA protein Name:"Protein of unknown function" AED:0.00 eAED:0.00 QI:95/1/1/1/0.66/0.75/4/421/285
MSLFSCVWILLVCGSCLSWGQEMPSLSPMLGGYPPVDVNELDPMTLNWNQVHYLVREMLIEADDLKREHDLLYKELQSCYGLEDCLSGFDLLNKNIDTGILYAEDSLLSSLQRGREAVSSNYGARGESELREYQRVQDYLRNQQQSGASSGTTAVNGVVTNSNFNNRGYNQNSFGRNVTYSYSSQRGSSSASGTNQYNNNISNGGVRNSQFPANPTRPFQLGGGELGTGGRRGNAGSGDISNNNDNGASSYGRTYQYSYEYSNNNYGNQNSRGYDREIPDDRRGK